jgi:subtilisin-like proprotein convertase family protein
MNHFTLPIVPLFSVSLFFFLSGALLTPLAAAPLLDQRHHDYRSTPKLLSFPTAPSLKSHHNFLLSYKKGRAPAQQADPESIARNYLMTNMARFGTTYDSVRMIEKKESLLGYHLTFEQLFRGVPIESSHIIVSILKASGMIYQVYNTLQTSHQFEEKSPVKIGASKAKEIAWHYLGSQGSLVSQPEVKLMYKADAKGLTPLFHVIFSVTEPAGDWKIAVDATSGTVRAIEKLETDSRKQTLLFIKERFGTTTPQKPLKAAEKEWSQQAQQQESSGIKAEAYQEIRDGVGWIFDPDPRTYLQDVTLTDESDPALFEEAYVERELRDLKFDGTTYYLQGPWVKIEDFDPPETPPTTTTDGIWRFKRGEQGLNDAMTYFHLDQAQRYIQSLGFAGATGIQYGPITADADGQGGNDNSVYQFQNNRISFGHGCVDDNEDADVILHEYMHAISHFINSNFQGGDTGAMGEGFGDYWALSYSSSTPQGESFFPAQVYSWDAQGNCWPGRSLDKLQARYDYHQAYGAHTNNDGFISDEIWGTPLFQTLVRLKELGVPREEADQIILQSQFGLGSGLKMRDMAQAIIAAARQLHPYGPHADIFFDQFLKIGIVEGVLEAGIDKLRDASFDGLLSRGERADLLLYLKNNSQDKIENARISLVSPDPALKVDPQTLTLASLPLGARLQLPAIFGFEVDPSASCGIKNLNLQVTQDHPERTTTLILPVTIGKDAGSVTASVEPSTPIVDNEPAGTTSVIEVQSETRVTSDFKIKINIQHGWQGDLRILLTSPSGTTLRLHDQTGGSHANIIGTYPLTLTSLDQLSALIGEPLGGKWTLSIADLSSGIDGVLVSWGIEQPSYVCD